MRSTRRGVDPPPDTGPCGEKEEKGVSALCYAFLSQQRRNRVYEARGRANRHIRADRRRR
jgi:hypothetical protein